MRKELIFKIALLIAIIGIFLLTVGGVMLSILNQTVDFGSSGNDKNETVVTPTPSQTMDIEENNPLTSPTPTPVVTTTPEDIVLPSNDSNNWADSEIAPTTPPDEGPTGPTTGEYVSPNEEEWVDESIPNKQYSLQSINEVSEENFGSLNQTQSLGVNYYFQDHTLYGIIKNGTNSSISYKGFYLLGSIGTQNIFMCTWKQAGQFNSYESKTYKCKIDDNIDTNQIAVSVIYY